MLMEVAEMRLVIRRPGQDSSSSPLQKPLALLDGTHQVPELLLLPEGRDIAPTSPLIARGLADDSKKVPADAMDVRDNALLRCGTGKTSPSTPAARDTSSPRHHAGS
eukprot:TRINITY_DN10883_c0_g3_i6.p2 TRINITY_DN10883_c0_g3~~TRINITY_DN10883_c0_g3_i6.p2  ORF type:complete len:107 (+),score=8.39 TRINITY_DN10883_c0_g3_i6:195-515(+)